MREHSLIDCSVVTLVGLGGWDKVWNAQVHGRPAEFTITTIPGWILEGPCDALAGSGIHSKGLSRSLELSKNNSCRGCRGSEEVWMLPSLYLLPEKVREADSLWLLVHTQTFGQITVL